MRFTDDELGNEERAALQELMEFARKRQALDLRQRYGKPLPPTEADEAIDETGSLEGEMRGLGGMPDGTEEGGSKEDSEIPGVEADDGRAENDVGEGSDESLSHEQLRALLARMTQGG